MELGVGVPIATINQVGQFEGEKLAHLKSPNKSRFILALRIPLASRAVDSFWQKNAPDQRSVRTAQEIF